MSDEEAGSFRMIATLGIAGMVAGVAIVGIYMGLVRAYEFFSGRVVILDGMEADD